MSERPWWDPTGLPYAGGTIGEWREDNSYGWFRELVGRQTIARWWDGTFSAGECPEWGYVVRNQPGTREDADRALLRLVLIEAREEGRLYVPSTVADKQLVALWPSDSGPGGAPVGTWTRAQYDEIMAGAAGGNPAGAASMPSARPEAPRAALPSSGENPEPAPSEWWWVCDQCARSDPSSIAQPGEIGPGTRCCYLHTPGCRGTVHRLPRGEYPRPVLPRGCRWGGRSILWMNECIAVERIGPSWWLRWTSDGIPNELPDYCVHHPLTGNEPADRAAMVAALHRALREREPAPNEAEPAFKVGDRVVFVDVRPHDCADGCDCGRVGEIIESRESSPHVRWFDESDPSHEDQARLRHDDGIPRVGDTVRHRDQDTGEVRQADEHGCLIDWEDDDLSTERLSTLGNRWTLIRRAPQNIPGEAPETAASVTRSSSTGASSGGVQTRETPAQWLARTGAVDGVEARYPLLSRERIERAISRHKAPRGAIVLAGLQRLNEENIQRTHNPRGRPWWSGELDDDHWLEDA